MLPNTLKIMTNQIASYEKTSKIILLLSIAIFTFWVLTKTINVYHFSFVGVIFEVLWLPILALTFVLPVMSIVYWWKEKFDLRSLNFYSVVLLIITIIAIIFYR